MTNVSTAAAHPEGHEGGVHITSPRTLLTVWGALLCLTVLTVAVTWVDLGQLALLVALGIAMVKASLVLLYFMHLRWERPMNAVTFITALLFVALFIGFAMMDSLAYRSEKIPDYAPRVNGNR